MGVLRRLAIWTVLAGLGLFAVQQWYGVWLEETHLRASARRELLLLGRAVQTAAEAALRDGQTADVRAVFERLEWVTETVEIYLLHPDGRLREASQPGQRPGADIAPRIAALEAAPVRADQGDFWIDPHAAIPNATLILPLIDGDRRLAGYLMLRRALDELDGEIDAVRTASALLLVVHLAVSLALGAVFGRTHLSAPLARLRAAMEQAGSGVDAAVAPLAADAQGELGRVARVFNHMIAARRAAQAELRAAEEARAALVEVLRRYDRLATAGELSAALAHEIGSPLQVMALHCEALTAHADPEVVHAGERLAAQCQRITRIVSRLLDFSRPAAAQVEGGIALHGPVAAVVDLVQHAARRARVALHFSVPTTLPPVQADPDAVQQIALNLVQNALRACVPGGAVTLTLAAEPGDRWVCLEVADDGHGMNPDEVTRAVEPFVRFDPGAGGTGLGLTVVRTLAEAMGGRLEIDSQAGLGTRVRVRLPLAETPATRRT